MIDEREADLLTRVGRACVVVVTLYLAIAIVGWLVTSCGPRTPAQAEALYTAEQLSCVERSATLAASRECRAGVDARWGVDAGARP